MYCSTCGKQNPANARYCTSCGQPSATAAPAAGAPEPPYTPYAVNIPNHLIPAILTTICCCLPLGIVSIVYAAQVNGKIGNGDLAGAKRDSDSARTWAWISFIVGIPANILLWWLWL